MKKDVYSDPVIIERNNVIAKVYSPILTDNEKNRRMDKIIQATIRLVLSMEKDEVKQ